MDNAFYLCNSLISLDLSSYKMEILLTLKNMFYNCSSLEYLDISNFNFDDLYFYDGLFNNTDKLKYINFGFGSKDILQDIINMTSDFNERDQLIVCQKGNYIQNPKDIYACCNFSKSHSKCDYNNYITVKYKEMVKYTSGFINNNIPSRNEVYYILNKDSILNKDDTIIIEEDSSIDILFSKPIKSLEKIFNGEIDTNSKSILNIDLSNFDSSSVTSTEEIFSGCIQITSLDLSFFDTSSVSNVNKMFSGCASLEFLDISNFDTKNLKTCDEMFNGADIIKYLRLYNVKKSSLK